MILIFIFSRWIYCVTSPARRQIEIEICMSFECYSIASARRHQSSSTSSHLGPFRAWEKPLATSKQNNETFINTQLLVAWAREIRRRTKWAMRRYVVRRAMNKWIKNTIYAISQIVLYTFDLHQISDVLEEVGLMEYFAHNYERPESVRRSRVKPLNVPQTVEHLRWIAGFIFFFGVTRNK